MGSQQKVRKQIALAVTYLPAFATACVLKHDCSRVACYMNVYFSEAV